MPYFFHLPPTTNFATLHACLDIFFPTHWFRGNQENRPCLFWLTWITCQRTPSPFGLIRSKGDAVLGFRVSVQLIWYIDLFIYFVLTCFSFYFSLFCFYAFLITLLTMFILMLCFSFFFLWFAFFFHLLLFLLFVPHSSDLHPLVDFQFFFTLNSDSYFLLFLLSPYFPIYLVILVFWYFLVFYFFRSFLEGPRQL